MMKKFPGYIEGVREFEPRFYTEGVGQFQPRVCFETLG
jgi:hypothetical protein